jgi:hypothetical protein
MEAEMRMSGYESRMATVILRLRSDGAMFWTRIGENKLPPEEQRANGETMLEHWLFHGKTPPHPVQPADFPAAAELARAVNEATWIIEPRYFFRAASS